MIGDVDDFFEMETLYAPAESFDCYPMGTSLQDSIVSSSNNSRMRKKLRKKIT
jgi:hypothetical protein